MAQENDKVEIIKPPYGDQFHYNKYGQLHNENDMPAVIYGIGSLRWYKNGLWHRDGDKPAAIDYDGSCYWFQNNLLHRIGGPAIILYTGAKWYYVNGKEVLG